MDALTNGVTIITDDGTSYHSFTNFGLAIGNTDYIGEPEYETHYADVVGREGFVDMTEYRMGRVVYKERAISIEFGGVNPAAQWDNVISNMRNLFHGRHVKLIFDNDPDWYWNGRAEINDFDRFRNLGTFKLVIPKADPMKRSVNIQSGFSNINVTSSYTTKTAVITDQQVKPTFIVSNLTGLGTDGSLTIYIYAGTTAKALRSITADGTYIFPDVWLEDGDKIRMNISNGASGASGTVSIEYRQASL